MNGHEKADLPTNPVERRRLQNRYAQRKYRSRRHQQQVSLVLADSADEHAQQHQVPEQTSPPTLENAGSYAIDFSIDTLFNTVPIAGLSTLRVREDVERPYIPPPNAYACFPTIPDSSCDHHASAVTERTELAQPAQGTQTKCSVMTEMTLQPRTSAMYNTPSSDQVSSLEDLSVLHIAAFCGRTAIVSTLLDLGLNIHDTDSEGRTSLHFAAMKDHADVVRTLCKRGAAIDLPDILGRAPIHWATLQQREESLKALIECGADINATDQNSWTAVHVCVERGWVNGLAHVLRAGGDIHRKAKKCNAWESKDWIAD